MNRPIVHLMFMLWIIGMVMTSRSEAVAVPSDTTQQDSSVIDTTYIFNNVNVILETAWTDPEVIENVTVQLRCLNDDPFTLCYKDINGEKNEIRLIKGMTVKIISRDTNTILKTIIKPEVKQEPLKRTSKM